MQPDIPSVAKQFLYFSDSTSAEVRNATYSLFRETWNKIPKEDQQTIEEHLEFIVIKPIDDPLYPNTAALTRVSPTQPTWMSWIIWYPSFPISLKKKSTYSA